MALVPPDNQPAAALWDEAIQGSDHTTGRGRIPQVNVDDPEGAGFYGNKGDMLQIPDGTVYVKTTDNSVDTGWGVVTVTT